MTSRRWDDDEVLLRDLAEALGSAGPAAARVREIGEAAFTWHGIDEELELATLVYDSLVDSDVLVRGGGEESRRTVVFESSSVSLQLEKTAGQLVGQVVPGDCGDVSIISAAGEVVRVRADELGCFCVEALPPGPVRLRWDASTGNLVTDWIAL